MNRRPASPTMDKIAYRSGALPAYFLGRSAAVWLTATHRRSIAAQRQDTEHHIR